MSQTAIELKKSVSLKSLPLLIVFKGGSTLKGWAGTIDGGGVLVSTW